MIDSLLNEMTIKEIKDNLNQFNLQNDEMDGYLQQNNGCLRPLEKLSPLNSSKLNSIQAATNSTCNSSVTNLIQIYEGSSKNTSPKGGSSSSSQEQDDSGNIFYHFYLFYNA